MNHKTKSSEPAFTIVYDVVLTDYDLGPHAGWLYVQIKSYTRQGDETAFPSITTLAKRCGMGKRTVQRHLKTLEDKGLIGIQRRTSEQGDPETNLYTIKDPLRNSDGGWCHSDMRVVSQRHEGSVTESPKEEPLEEKPLKEKNTLPSGNDTATPTTEKQKSDKSELNAHFDAVKDAWSLDAGASGFIVNVCGMLFGDRKVKGEWKKCALSEPMTVDELAQWAKHARADSRNAHGGLPTKPETIQRHIAEWRANKNSFVPSKDRDPAEVINSLKWVA